MLKSLVDGELPLKDTFWKYGALALPLLSCLNYLCGTVLSGRLRGLSILNYFMNTRPYAIEGTTVALTIAYVTTLFMLLVYSIIIIIAVFKSSATYDRSLWLRHLSRFLIIVIVYLSIKRFFI